MRAPFAHDWAFTSILGVIAFALTVIAVAVINQVLLTCIENELGIFEISDRYKQVWWPERRSSVGGASLEEQAWLPIYWNREGPKEHASSLQKYCSNDGEVSIGQDTKLSIAKIRSDCGLLDARRFLNEVDQIVHRGHKDRPKAVFWAVCTVIQAMRHEARQGFAGIVAKPGSNGCPSEKRESSNKSAPSLLVVASNSPSDNEALNTDGSADALPVARIGLIDECHGGGATTDLGWHHIQCLVDRIRGVGVSTQNEPPMFVLDDTTNIGLEGTVYHFPYSRAVRYIGDPASVYWKTSGIESQSNPDRFTLEIQTLQAGLTALDDLLIKRIDEIEDAVFLQRFILLAINHPFQFCMLVLGVWAALIYMTMLLEALSIGGASRTEKLARWISSQHPHGNRAQVLATPSSRPTAVTVPYGTEIRNAIDELHHASNVRGKVWADTIAEWIPLLGFIGTVYGMILAMGAVGGVIQADPGPELYIAMSEVTGNLSVAFNTTLVGLVIALILTLLRRMVVALESNNIGEASWWVRK